jgi:serine/threonine protein kinase
MARTQKPWEEKWSILRRLGRGGQGETFLVTSTANAEQRGVLKVLNAGKSVQARGRMRREVVNLDTLAKAQVKVPQVLDGNTGEYAEPETTLYFVMDYIPGKSLTEEVTTRKRIPLDQAAKIVKDICGTVVAAHSNDVLHRDLKPDNIIVRDFDAADLVIVDYGLSYLEADGPEDLTKVHEQFRNRFLSLPETNTPGGDRRDKRSDIAAVAGVLYYCLTGFEPGHLRDANGQPPHRRKGYSVREAIGEDVRCEQVERLLDRAFAVEVENRFQSGEEFLGRLETALKPQAPDEDPAVVSAELAKLVRLHDRPVLLAEYRQIAQRVFQSLLQQLSEAAQQVVPPFSATISGGLPAQENTFPKGIEPLSAGEYIMTVGIAPHSRYRLIAFAAGAKGNECLIVRKFGSQAEVKGSSGFMGPATFSQWEPVLWFQPDRVPDQDSLRSLVRASLNTALRAVAEDILPK